MVNTIRQTVLPGKLFAQSVPLMIWGEDYGIEVVASQEETESPGKPQF